MISKEIIEKKAVFMRAVREFFDSRGFLEVETPIMTPTVDPEPNLTPFETKFIRNIGDNSREEKPMYLVPSPEFQMKKLLGTGFHDKIYTITKVFRNGEEGGGRHNPEFTMLEWYRLGASYKEIMIDCEDLASSVGIKYEKPWKRVSVNELFIDKCGIDLEKHRKFEDLKSIAVGLGLPVSACKNWDDVFYSIFLNKIEPELGFDKPVFVYDYPATQAALAKRKSDNPFWAERFELYIDGNELCNAFSELVFADEQRKRFEDQLRIRRDLGKTVFPIDEELLSSLRLIKEPCAGNALGIDRLFMVLLGAKDVSDVLLFPFKNF